MRNVVGIEEYNKGESKEISGFKTLSDKKFEINFKKFNPGILWGGGIPFEPVPSHKLKDIPVKEQEATGATPPFCPGGWRSWPWASRMTRRAWPTRSSA